MLACEERQGERWTYVLEVLEEVRHSFPFTVLKDRFIETTIPGAALRVNMLDIARLFHRRGLGGWGAVVGSQEYIPLQHGEHDEQEDPQFPIAAVDKRR
jgi:hypothetical protein